jgi:hypothetical protein
MRCFAFRALFAVAFIAPAVRAGDEDNPGREALEALNEYIGLWKGAGGPDRSSAPENWKENISWSWKFKAKDAWLNLEFDNGKYFSKGELRYLPDEKKYQLTLKDKMGESQVFEGELKKGYLNLDRVDAKTGATFRLTMNTAADGVRFIYKFQKRAKGSTVFNRVYEVACNKEGESLAGGSKPKECVVTGGLGTIAVTHNGKTYYVCCTGCRDAFNENPEKIIKEYEERKKKGK